MRSKTITIREAASALDVRTQTILNYIKKGYFKCSVIGKSYQIDSESFNSFTERIYPKVVELTQLNASIDKELEEAKTTLKTIAQFNRSITALSVVDNLKSIFETIISYAPGQRDVAIALDYLSGKTIENLAKEYDLSRQRILQLIFRAMRRGKMAFASKLQQLSDIEIELDSLRKRIALLEYNNSKKEEHSCNTEDISPELCSILTKRVEDCGFTMRAMNCLRSAEIATIGQLVSWRKTDLLKFRNFGKKSIIELEEFLASQGLSFREY